MLKPTICVVGLGYIGLPTAILFANAGYKVSGYDINPHVVTAINVKRPLIHEPDLIERLSQAVDSCNLKAYSKPITSDIYIISVPTPVHHETNKPDNSYVISATMDILPLLKKGDLVVLESTVPPGTTKDVIGGLLEEHGLAIGEDVQLAHAPEKAIPGRLFFELENNDRVIGGIDTASTERTAELYSHLTQGRLMLTDSTTAEMVKLIENTYRDVNIALANEFALLAEKVGVDIWKAIEYANHHPRVYIHQPGPGVGGHCIAVDPWFLVDAAPEIMRLVTIARDINDHMPFYTVEKIKRILSTKSILDPKVTILGLTFKANIDDIRESPSFTICHILEKEGIQYSAFDPWVGENVIANQSSDLLDAVNGSDLIVLLVAHDKFKEMDPGSFSRLMRHRLLLDMKNGVDHESFEKAGFETFLLGRR